MLLPLILPFSRRQRFLLLLALLLGVFIVTAIKGCPH